MTRDFATCYCLFLKRFFFFRFHVLSVLNVNIIIWFCFSHWSIYYALILLPFQTCHEENTNKINSSWYNLFLKFSSYIFTSRLMFWTNICFLLRNQWSTWLTSQKKTTLERKTSGECVQVKYLNFCFYFTVFNCE